jgi:hypothetical protein
VPCELDLGDLAGSGRSRAALQSVADAEACGVVIGGLMHVITMQCIGRRLSAIASAWPSGHYVVCTIPQLDYSWSVFEIVHMVRHPQAGLAASGDHSSGDHSSGTGQ